MSATPSPFTSSAAWTIPLLPGSISSHQYCQVCGRSILKWAHAKVGSSQSAGELVYVFRETSDRFLETFLEVGGSQEPAAPRFGEVAETVRAHSMMPCARAAESVLPTATTT